MFTVTQLFLGLIQWIKISSKLYKCFLLLFGSLPNSTTWCLNFCIFFFFLFLLLQLLLLTHFLLLLFFPLLKFVVTIVFDLIHLHALPAANRAGEGLILEKKEWRRFSSLYLINYISNLPLPNIKQFNFFLINTLHHFSNTPPPLPFQKKTFSSSSAFD